VRNGGHGLAVRSGVDSGQDFDEAPGFRGYGGDVRGDTSAGRRLGKTLVFLRALTWGAVLVGTSLGRLLPAWAEEPGRSRVPTVADAEVAPSEPRGPVEGDAVGDPDDGPSVEVESAEARRAREMVGQRAAITPGEAAIKKTGFYVTGLPLANFDPNFGVGFGVRGNLFDNGSAQEPLFRYAPYKKRLSITLFATTGGLQFHWLDFDAPFVSGSAFRFRAQAVFEQNVDRHYYGIGARSLARLQYPGAPGSFGSIDGYETSQRRALDDGTTYSRYDRFFFRRPIAFFGLERSFFGARVRPLFGVAVSHATVRTFDGKSVSAVDAAGDDRDARSRPTRLGEDCQRGAIVGCGGGFDNYFRIGLAYDTRDFEPDPTKGVFLDAELDVRTRALGGAYSSRVLLTAARGYWSPFPRLTKLVVAARVVGQVASAGTPFFSLNVLPFTEDPKTGLGGFRTLRGYSQDRFVGPVLALANLEVRWTFVSFRAAGQHLAFMAVPFLDLGRVFDRVSDATLRGFERGQGGGLRVAWNQATVVMFDYGVSREGSALYVNFGHIF
jgi:hypothetical protein